MDGKRSKHVISLDVDEAFDNIPQKGHSCPGQQVAELLEAKVPCRCFEGQEVMRMVAEHKLKHCSHTFSKNRELMVNQN